MKLTDIIALAKQGYKPSDIRDLIELAESADTEPEKSSDTDHEKGGDTDDQENEKTDDLSESGSGTKEDNKSEDGSKEIDDLKKEIKKLKDDLKKAQKFNQSKDNSDEQVKSDEEVFRDAFKNLL